MARVIPVSMTVWENGKYINPEKNSDYMEPSQFAFPILTTQVSELTQFHINGIQENL